MPYLLQSTELLSPTRTSISSSTIITLYIAASSVHAAIPRTTSNITDSHSAGKPAGSGAKTFAFLHHKPKEASGG
ncbi:hypothetical protein [Cohnella rhizosphaerae]|uniref:Uncharacterized protein n=1 Tax=Cohnella rhizosphaerae TaxID=1457232 RepID=A0A9X4L3G6_9BACL|nr:hypothetical protein [Cohnella rhizosphaerae]MDG0812979.1 hypothetical protein [Cohnella rhizosphaerae]